MAGFKAATRYAKGLMQFAQETGQAQVINQEMVDVRNAIESSRELAQFLESPLLDSKRKNTIAKEIFKGFSPSTQNFITLVINQRREKWLKQIAKQFNDLYDFINNTRTAEIITATPLDDSLIQRIVDQAKAIMGAEYSYKVDSKIDEKLIGGYVLRVGDKQIDSSVKYKLDRLKKEFDKNDYIPKF